MISTIIYLHITDALWMHTDTVALILMSCIRIQLSALQIFRIIIFLFCINRLCDLFFLSQLLFLIISLLRLYRFFIFNKVTGFFPCLGKTPRFFCFGPNRKCYVANEDSDTIVEFDFDSATGQLIPTLNIVHTGSPVCIVFTQD